MQFLLSSSLPLLSPSVDIKRLPESLGPVQLEMRLLLLPLLAGLATVHGALAADSILREDTEVGQ